MSEEILENISAENTEPNVFLEAPKEPEQPSLVPGFKSVCLRLGLTMIVVFASRILCNVLSGVIYPWVEDLDTVPMYLLNLALSVVFLYAIPMVAAMFILKSPIKNSGRNIYAKPKYFGRAMAIFPAGYGIAILVRLLTMLLGSLFEGSTLGESFHVTEDALVTTEMSSALIIFFQTTVIAPILEELWYRGMVMESLRPYGNGFAIFISAILFGMTHSNFEQFFYATALGIFLGYIAISTQSIVTTTIMHALFNSISGCMILLTADENVGNYLIALERGEEGVITFSVGLYFAWLALVMILLVVGVIMAIYKFTKIKKYRVPKVQTEISAPRRWGIFLSRYTVIISVILAADCFIWNFLSVALYTGIANIFHL